MKRLTNTANEINKRPSFIPQHCSIPAWYTEPYDDLALKKTILIDVVPPEKPLAEAKEEIEELRRLVTTYGGIVVVEILQKRGRPSARTFLGTGKAEEAAEIAKKHRVDMVIFNDFLRPHHSINLSKLFTHNPLDETGRSNIPIWDRTDIILKIFEKHAKSQVAQLQIRLAWLKHQIPKIYQYQTKLFDRERGGIRGTRGSGEKGVESEKRHIREQIREAERKLELVNKVHDNQRNQRRRAGLKTVALVGYTNAGKSTLLRALTRKDVPVRDELFTTLDTSIGALWLPNATHSAGGQKVLIADTIGFIQNLPPHLIESFTATLSEVQEAELLLHIIDSSDPHQNKKAQVVDEILSKLIDKKKPVLRVYNKCDQQTFCFLQQRGRTIISAEKKLGLENLKTLIQDHLIL